MGTPLRRTDRVDLRGALLCDRPADFTVMHVMPVIFRVISASLDRLAVCDDGSLLCMLGIRA
jgi:hypothetical protein